MAITVSDKDLGIVTAYGYAVSKGYAGTEEEYAELMASYADVAEDAAESASNSEAYAVGTRDGDDVESSDPAYHNNSKYYAEQAANVAESIPLDYTELSNDVTNLKSVINSLDNHVRYETEEVVAEKRVSTTSGTKIDKPESEFNVSIASGASFRFRASGTNLINKFALYYNEGGSSYKFGTNLSPNTDYNYTAPMAVTSLYIYIGATDVIGSGTLKLTVSNVVHNNDSVDKHIIDLESDVEELSFLGNRIDYNDTLIGGNIGELPPIWFERGGSVVSNGVIIKLDEQTFRVRSIRDMVLDYDLTLIPNSGYRIYAYIYSNGSWTQYGWITTPYNIPAKTIFRVLIAQKPEDTTITADVSTYCSNITLSFPLKRVIDSVSPVKTLALETMKSIAHRGNVALAPQNTKPAYIMARKQGALWAENDVAKTADGYYVMWHDTTLKKLGDIIDISGFLVYTDGTIFYYYDSDNSVLYTYENGDYVVSSESISGLTRCNGNNYSVESLNYADIRRFDFGAWFDKQYAGTQILNFAEWVLLCKQLGMKIYIDHKFSYTQSQAQDLVAIVKRYGMLRNAVWLVMPTVAEYIRQVDSEAIIAWIPNVESFPNIDDAITYINRFNLNASGNCIIEMDGKSMTETDAQKILNANYMCEAYYVDYGSTTEQQIFEKIRALSEYGVQGLTLDKYNVEDAFYYLLA